MRVPFFMLAMAGLVILAQGAVRADPVPEQPVPLAVLPEPESDDLQPSVVSMLIPAGTVVQLELVDTVGSAIHRSGDHFSLRVTEPVMAGERVLLPAGTPVVGEVLHAAKSGFGGKPGELLLAARYIDSASGRIRLRSSFGAAGKDQAGLAAGVTIAVGVIGFVVRGKEYELPAGTGLSARIAEDTLLPAL